MSYHGDGAFGTKHSRVKNLNVVLVKSGVWRILINKSNSECFFRSSYIITRVLFSPSAQNIIHKFLFLFYRTRFESNFQCCGHTPQLSPKLSVSDFVARRTWQVRHCKSDVCSPLFFRYQAELYVSFLLGFFIKSKDGRDMFVQNLLTLSTDYTRWTYNFTN